LLCLLLHPLVYEKILVNLPQQELGVSSPSFRAQVAVALCLLFPDTVHRQEFAFR
jgi:hypothetical protein